MDELTTFRDAHRWLRWLTVRGVDACRALAADELHRPFEIGLGSVWGTLLHMHGAERIWIAALEGTEVRGMPAREEIPDWARLDAEWTGVRSRWDRYLAALTPAETARVMERHRDGKVFRQEVRDVLMQVPTHALYHNAQLSFMFRSMGRQFPDSAWLLWGRDRLAAGGA